MDRFAFFVKEKCHILIYVIREDVQLFFLEGKTELFEQEHRFITVQESEGLFGFYVAQAFIVANCRRGAQNSFKLVSLKYEK